MDISLDEEKAVAEAVSAFERQVGLTTVPILKVQAGNRQFLKFQVGREAPLYTYALHRAQQSLSPGNPFRGAMSLEVQKSLTFPNSLEASALLTLLTRSTREVSQDTSDRGYTVPYIPFQNREDHQLAQPASHIVKGRRGVGKSTLIRRAVEHLLVTPALVAVLDMQAYSMLEGDDLLMEVLHDVCQQLAQSSKRTAASNLSQSLVDVAGQILSGTLKIQRAPVTIRRALGQLTQATQHHAFVFLDDFHLIEQKSQPELLHNLHAGLSHLTEQLQHELVVPAGSLELDRQ